MRWLLTILFALSLLPTDASAARRLGLVIGNDTYAEVPSLEKARNDARAMSDTLEGLGFEVVTALDADRREMNRTISLFTAQLEPGDTALVFYAGHGVQIDGENYLLPVDIAAPTNSGEDFVKFESIGLSDLLDRVQRTGARTTLVFLDACRDNPFATTGRSIGGTRGLAQVLAPQGTFVVFSAGAQQQALDRLSDDDPDANSVFTRLLLPKLAQPGLELRDMVTDLRREVRNLARSQGHDQFPAYYDELLGEFFFANGPVREAPAAQEVAALEQVAPTQDALAQPAPEAVATRSESTAEPQPAVEAVATPLVEQAAVEAQQQAPAADPEPAPEPVEVAALPAQDPEPQGNGTAESRHLADRREIIRQTQAALNRLGCNAGGADGIPGPRTRSAFARFIAESGERLRADALGSQHALDVVAARRGTVCKQVAVATPPAPQGGGGTLAGRWSFSASCPLFVRATGWVNVNWAAKGLFRHSVRDSLGNSGSGTISVNGRNITGTTRWKNGVVSTFKGTVSADWRTFWLSDSVGCKSTYAKAG